MEDAPVEATTVVMPSLGEEEAESESTEHQHHSRNNSHTSVYVAVPQSGSRTGVGEGGRGSCQVMRPSMVVHHVSKQVCM